MINELVMTLVCYVDEQMAEQQASASIGHRFIVMEPQPEIWIEPKLNTFFHKARQFLTAPGIHLPDLARHLGMDLAMVNNHLTHLRLLGLVRAINEEEAVEIAERQAQENISNTSNKFLRASQWSAGSTTSAVACRG